ncbi:MAG: response regulator transcription factor [Lachnospiraceae bacterium]|nr:response regulator transcription factor [Lachnospiraceae bacterium]
MRLLFAEDEKDLNTILTKRLSEEGYSVDSCYDGETALEYLDSVEYDGAILDIMMPKRDGFSVVAEIRGKGNEVPILFLTARDAVEDRVRGLDIGANDYLIKPFAISELLARVRALVRRNTKTTGSILREGDLSLDLAAHTVTRGDKEIELSTKEFSLLSFLMQNPGIVLSREKIEDHVWNLDYEGGTNVVDVYISFLRKKIDSGFEEKLIHTVRGSGYVFRRERS